VGNAAREIGVETAVLLAFLEVEAAGRGFDRHNRPKMLFEPHVMYRNLAGPKRQKAIVQGVAYKRWGTKPYPRDSYPRLKIALGVDRNSGFMSASYGLAQILGENYRLAGFGSAEQMFTAFKQGEREQLLGMVAFLKSTGIAKHLQGKDFTKPESWIPAVSRYNGKGFRKNRYHIKCANAYIKHAKGLNAITGVAYGEKKAITNRTSTLKRGMKGEAVRNLQADLVDLGFDLGTIDGRFGDLTFEAVERFQGKHGLTVDGKAGPKTLRAITAALKTEPSAAPDQPAKLSIGIVGALIKALINLLSNWRN
jgi:hypothetical protein